MRDGLAVRADRRAVGQRPRGGARGHGGAALRGQQPFGGSKASGTNDKAGSLLNLLRWVSPRTIKETFVPPADYRYPFLG